MKLCVFWKNKTQMIEFERKIALSDAVRQSGFPVELPCGGNHTCGKCRVRVHGIFDTPSAEETHLLGKNPQGDIRLLCFAHALGNGKLYLPDPPQIKTYCTSTLPLGIYDMFPTDTYGIAVDLGTTTIAVYLYELSHQRFVDALGESNQQRTYGSDVIARIDYANVHSLKVLQTALLNQLTFLFSDILVQNHLSPQQVARVVVTGNTVMLHFLTGLNPLSIAEYPFTPISLFGQLYRANTLFPLLNNKAELYLPPCIGGYVGADFVCAMVASDFGSIDNVLLLDLGTNGEMAYCHHGKILCCSAAAGPAFEGTGITMGVPAIPGAIQKVWQTENGNVCCDTIGDLPAVGICGSGILSAISMMLDSGLLDRSGRLTEDNDRFVLGNSGVCITQADVRAVQLAKGAIAAGIHTLLHATEQPVEAIHEIWLCGGFGSQIDPADAVKIGLLPDGIPIQIKGNAAGTGASGLLMSLSLRQKGEIFSKSAQEISLSTDPYFMEQYVLCMSFEC